MVKTITWQASELVLLDQTKLPLKTEYIVCTNYQRVIEAIQKLEVRGAPAIGVAAAFAIVLAWKELMINDACNTKNIKIAAQQIVAARPTAVNLSWAVNLLIEIAAKEIKNGFSKDDVYQKLEKAALEILASDVKSNESIGENGAALLPSNATVMTICNAGALATCGIGTALGVVRKAYAQNKIKMVYSCETRPLLQGARLTVWELMQDKIPVTLITDSMAASVLSKYSIDAVIVGADRIALNGDTANKIGTLGLAVLARYYDVPFYIAAPAGTFDFSIATGHEIPIEERCENEVKSFRGVITTPLDALVYNPAFDVTPNNLISGIITEMGVLHPPYNKSIIAYKEQLESEK